MLRCRQNTGDAHGETVCDLRGSGVRGRAGCIRRRRRRLSGSPDPRLGRLLRRIGADITARVVGHRMGQILGQQIVVENKTGAGSSLAAEQVARAPKDGYTLLMATIANVINAVVTPNLSFDFRKDFAPVVRLTTTPNILVVHPSVGVKASRN